MAERLNPQGNPVKVGTVTLRTPRLDGFAEMFQPQSPRMRSAEVATEQLDAVFARTGMVPRGTVVIERARETALSNVASRSTVRGEEAIEVTVPAVSEDWEQVLLYVDEAGVTTWHFARDAQGKVDATRGTATKTFLIPRRVQPTPVSADGTRGWFGSVGKKILKVVAFPILDPIIGEVGDFFAGKWEQAKRPYRMRSFTSGDFASVEALSLDGETWRRLGEGRALLMVHGTLSRAHVAFSRLQPNYVDDLHRAYGGRVFAFDHFTLSETPKQNVEWLLTQIPEGVHLDIDIVCHSRGGLVSRTLAEKQSEFSMGSKSIRVGKIVFVAATNNGTPLASAEHLGDFVDTYTTLLNFLPDTGAVEILEGVVTVVKQIALATLKGLDGIRSMAPHGEFIKWLNQGQQIPGLQYYGMSGDFEPIGGGFDAVKDALMDKIFDMPNDLVVPTDSTWEENGSGMFPLATRRVFGSGDGGIAHSGFFPDDRARKQIAEWLGVTLSS